MLKFIVDTQLPPKLTYSLKDLGADAIHTTYFENGHLLADESIIKIAAEENRIVVSKDSDSRDYLLLKGSPPSLLLIKTGNIINKDLIKLIEQNYPTISKLVEGGNSMVIVDKQNITAYKS